MHVLEGEENIVPESQLDTQHTFFGYVKKVHGRNEPPHPIYRLLKESGIEMPVFSAVATKSSRLCCIFSQGVLPTRSLSNVEVERCKELAMRGGYDVWIDPSPQSIQEAGWVIGVECDALFSAASQGIKTSLVSTGIGQMVYQKMFPNGQIVKNVIS
jgi:hypothetical protein